MAVVKMVALTMFGPHEEMEPVAREMVLSGGFQPLPIDFLVGDRSIRSKVTTESDNPYDDLLNKMTVVWKAAGERLPEPDPIPVDQDFSYYGAKKIVEQATGNIEAWGNRREVLTEELDRLEATRCYVEVLKNLGMSTRELAEATFAIPYFGRLSKENYTRLIESTENSPLVIAELSSSSDNVWVLVFTVPGYVEGTKKILGTVYFKEYSLKEISEHLSVEDPLGQIENNIRFHRDTIKELEDAARKVLQERRPEFDALYSKLYTMQRVYDLCKGRGEVSGMYVLSGWIPEDTYGSIKETIEKKAPRTSVVAEQMKNIPYSGVRIPTMLRNNRLVRAFQDVVALYSVPSYGEVDPSPFVALTFILFFGFMFGDVGHGALLFLGSIYLGKKGVLNKSLAYVMKCASASSIVFGFLYGSVMGYEHLLPALWLSPMHDTGKLFGVAIIAGVVMISFGMILNIIIRYREKDFGRLLFDGQGLAGLFVYWGAAGAIFISVMKIPMPFPVSYIWYVIIALIALTLFRDVLARTLLKQQVESEPASLQVFEVIHNLMNYFTNTASFVRLAAFALNHVALSFAVMAISKMLTALPGGSLWKLLALLLGNLLIIGLEGLIVFIQVLRLEYYEFFSKFYRGGGNVFKPVTWKRERGFQKT